MNFTSDLDRLGHGVATAFEAAPIDYERYRAEARAARRAAIDAGVARLGSAVAALFQAGPSRRAPRSAEFG